MSSVTICVTILFFEACLVWILVETERYDVWNDVPCTKYFSPDNCDNHNILNLDDYDRCGPARLESIIARNYFLGASGRRITYRENKDNFDKIKIEPRMLRDVSRNSITTKALDLHLDFPIGFSPVAFHKLAHPDGEIATLSAILNKRMVMIVSCYASTRIEDLGQLASGTSVHLWLQMYIFRNRSITLDLIRKAERSGFRAIVITADTPTSGILTCDAKDEIKELGAPIANLKIPQHDENLDPSVTFSYIAWMRTVTNLPVVVKGLLSGEDAKMAILAGASAIIVSNHGGRQVDGSQATIDALPEVVSAVRSLHPVREVYMDGGLRRGTDVYKAIARGATMVFVGRPVIWGLAIGGAKGVRNMIDTLVGEFNNTMIIAGSSNVNEISTDTLINPTNRCDC